MSIIISNVLCVCVRVVERSLDFLVCEAVVKEFHA